MGFGLTRSLSGRIAQNFYLCTTLDGLLGLCVHLPHDGLVKVVLATGLTDIGWCVLDQHGGFAMLQRHSSAPSLSFTSLADFIFHGRLRASHGSAPVSSGSQQASSGFFISLEEILAT